MGRVVNVSGADAKAASSGFVAYPAGEYIGQIIDAKPGVYKGGANKGKPIISVQFKFTEAGPGDEYVGRKYTEFQVPDFTTFASGSSAFLFYQFWKALGVKFPEKGNEDVELPDLSEILGEEIGIRLTREEDDYRSTDEETVYRNRTGGFFDPSKGVKDTSGEAAAGDADEEFVL